MTLISKCKIAVIIPCFRVRKHILDVISRIGSDCTKIYIVDDACPEKTGMYVLENCEDNRISVIHNATNQGVGGAMIAGYKAAIKDDMEIAVKIDGDGQMDPGLLSFFVRPIINGEADYCKGNRFFNIEKLSSMPRLRLLGNSGLSFLSKLSTGYWDLFDPTNGYTALHLSVAQSIPLEKLSKRYFFESDLLFRLNILRACVVDIPMDAKYENEKSSLVVKEVAGEFLFGHVRNICKRVFYNYYLRNMSLASLELPVGSIMLIFGLIYGVVGWYKSIASGIPASTGTVMVSALPLMLGIQFLLAFVAYDISNIPRVALHPRLRSR